MLNISQESRDWLADPSNRLCDRPGSWYCPGQYPPGLPLSVPKTHRHVDYDNPESYVEEMRMGSAPYPPAGGEGGGKKKGGKKKKATPVPEPEPEL